MQDFDSSPSVTDNLDSGANTPSVDTVANTENTQTSDQSTAPSSGAPEGESKETLLDAVMRVVKPADDADKLKVPGEGTPPGSDQPQSEKADGAGATEDELSEDPSKEEMDRYHSRTRKRVERLLDQRNAARDEADRLRGPAQIAEGLREYLTTNDIAREDFSLLLDLGSALRRGDWATFYQGVRPYMELAEEALGVKLPADLQQAVQQGQLTTDAARRYSQERYARMLAETNAAHAAQAAQTVHTHHTVTALKQSINSAVSAWEASVRQTDPDYGHKQDAVKNLLHAVVNELGAPQNPEQAVEIAKEAYRRANEMVSRFAPKPRATAPVPSSVHRSNAGAPEPKSLMEAAMLGLARTRRA